MRTGATPAAFMPSHDAAPGERSITRPAMKGPRSLMRTSTDAPLSRLVTRTIVSIGKVRCAAVKSLLAISSPLAVRLCFFVPAYQEASPTCAKAGRRSPPTGGTGIAAGVGMRSDEACGGVGPAQAERQAAAIASAPSDERSRIRDVPRANSIALDSMEFIAGFLPAKSVASVFSRKKTTFFGKA